MPYATESKRVGTHYSAESPKLIFRRSKISVTSGSAQSATTSSLQPAMTSVASTLASATPPRPLLLAIDRVSPFLDTISPFPSLPDPCASPPAPRRPAMFSRHDLWLRT